MPVYDPKTGGTVLSGLTQQAAPAAAAVAAAAPTSTPPPSKDPAALAAAAQGGQAGLTAYQQSVKTVDELQGNALANARSRAAIVGGPEAQGFEKIAGQFYDRTKANLATSHQADQNLQGQNRAAFDKYFGQLKGDMGAINDYIKNTLGGYEAKKRTAAEKALANKFPLDEILGETEYGLPGAQKEAEGLKTSLTQEQARLAQAQNGEFSKGILDRMNANAKELDEIARLTKGGVKGGLGVVKSWLPGGDKAVWGANVDKRTKEMAKRQQELTQEQTRLQDQLDRTRANERKIAETSTARIATLQSDYDKKAALATPEGFARNIAVTKYGQDPMKAAGKLTPEKFSSTEKDKRVYGEQAVSLAGKLGISGGAKRVAEILGDTEVQEDLDTLETWAESGAKTLDEVKREMGKAYLSTKDPKDRDKYNVIIEMTARLPWKSSR